MRKQMLDSNLHIIFGILIHERKELITILYYNIMMSLFFRYAILCE